MGAEADRKAWIIARDKPGLLAAMMHALAGPDARISFEGNLSRCSFPDALAPSDNETSHLVRQTYFPRQDFAVLPLTADSVKPILGVLLSDNRCLKDIFHIQIESGGSLAFGSYDNFHDECIVAFAPVPSELLKKLVVNGVVRSWTYAEVGQHRWHD